LFHAESADDLVAQSVRLAGNAEFRAALGEAGRRFVNTERSWAKLAERYVEIYSQLLGSKN
jgi:glycosyltransferase involved in cell wall biosynthesis